MPNEIFFEYQPPFPLCFFDYRFPRVVKLGIMIWFSEGLFQLIPLCQVLWIRNPSIAIPTQRIVPWSTTIHPAIVLFALA